MFIQFLIIAVLSLGITYVLFTKLKAKAKGKGDMWGTTITFGGSLAGFVVVSFVLFEAYSLLSAQQSEELKTNIEIHGEWVLQITSKDGRTETGIATIHQKDNHQEFDISAQIKDINSNLITFSSEFGVIKENRIIYMYETNTNEIGIALGDLASDYPETFIVHYYDIMDSDKNQNAEGTVQFIRKVD